MRDLDNHFGGYNHLAHLPRADQALHTLRKAASCVKPLMRKRGWRVGLLSEFLPEQANLLGLNINRGEQIQLRLRYAGDWNQFLPFEQVLDTLLHELSHIVWGPHDHNFQRQWNELRDEWEVLQIKGFSGEGFLGKGQALGGNRIPVEEVRRRARAAAQERARINKIRKDPGHRLGGDNAAAPPSSRRRLRDLLANAAQARNPNSTAVVDSGCATGTQVGAKAAEDALRNGFQTKAEMDDANSIAIAQALQELYEQEEDNRIYDGLAGPPTPGGLTWDPEQGLQPVAGPSKPTSRSSSRTREPSAPSKKVPPRRPVSATQIRSNGVATPPPPATLEYNPHGVPVSRLVREAETKQRGNRDSGTYTPTHAVQNWPTSETGANFGVLPTSPGRPTSSGSAGESWGCPQCTFSNHGSMDRCEMCDAPRPQVENKPLPGISSTAFGPNNSFGARNSPSNGMSHGYDVQAKPIGWSCHYCGTFMETEWWTCSQCGMMKMSS